MVKRVLLGLAVVFVVAAVAPRARAQGGTAEARALFEQGRGLASDERWVEALDVFRRSQAIVDRPGTVFNIAAVLMRLGRARETIETVDRYLAMTNPRHHAARRRSARALRNAAEASLRHVVLHVSPEEARVEIDGQIVEPGGSTRSLTLDPGAHAVTVTLTGYETAHFTLEPGEDERSALLPPSDGTLVVRSSVATASIAIDGEDAGTGRAERTVIPGLHEVALAAEGYLDFQRRVEIAPGEHALVEATLDPIPQDQSILHSPRFWGLTSGSVALVVVTVIVVAVATAGTKAPYGGSSNVVLTP